jgi:pimeloyl-ACP methyl ester carboxylesterase
VSKGKLTLPVLAIGGDHSYGAHAVRSAVINNSVHWIMEEQPQQAIAVIIPFLEEK